MTETPKPTNAHVGFDPETIRICFAHYLKYALAKDRYTSQDWDRYVALSLAVRDRLIERWIETQQTYHHRNVKRVYYLSMEFLMGRSLSNNIINLDMAAECKEALGKLGLNWEELSEQEVDAGLGNGGLGRLAACFLDSMATLGYPGMGYGIRYEYGIFRQQIRNGVQVESPDEWLRFRNVWEIERPEYSFPVGFGGSINERWQDGKSQFVWEPAYVITGVPYDTPIIGYGRDNVNTLRLWSAKTGVEFNLSDFDQGDYVEAVKHKIEAETLTKVLYPNDTKYAGKDLRFRQQYFFVTCSLQDIMRRFKVHNPDITTFADKVAIQLNDTHPSIGIAELMRILLDQEGLAWDVAWQITVKTFGYTNHTLLPEALEKWPVEFFEKLLPRHLQIIYELNRRFLDSVVQLFPQEPERVSRMSIVEEGETKQIRMAHLATIGSHCINGVSELHSNLLKNNLLRDFYAMFPERFSNKTNGITPRRWLLKANQGLANWISQRIGKEWITDLQKLRQLEGFAEDAKSREEFRLVKLKNKQNLAKVILKETGIVVNPEAIFDAHIKRIHEYKRPHLNLLHIIMLYSRIKANPNLDMVPRVFIFSGKAAPGYVLAKQIIRAIHAVAGVINSDQDIKNKLKVVFLPNYGVTLAERIIPAADVSEQISTAGMEASGTGNMKLALNGALTICTLDGSNIEIGQEVGKENIFSFGLTAEEIQKYKESGSYHPWDIYHSDGEIKKACDMLFSGYFSPDTPGLFNELRKTLLDYGDKYFVMADLRAYANCQSKIEQLYRNKDAWTWKSILNVARMGKFSSDRVIEEYAEQIWQVPSITINLADKQSHTIMQAKVHRGTDNGGF